MNIPKDKYISKLIKLVQQKQSEIQSLKKQLKTQKTTISSLTSSTTHGTFVGIDITNQLGNTTNQLKEVTQQILSMEKKMIWMEQCWKDQIVRCQGYQLDLKRVKKENQRLKEDIKEFVQQIQRKAQQRTTLQQRKSNQSQKFPEKQPLQTQEAQEIQSLLKQQIQSLKKIHFTTLSNKQKSLSKLFQQKNDLQHFYKKQIQIYKSSLSLRDVQLQQKVKEIQTFAYHSDRLKQKYQKFEQFCYEICQYIQTIHLKYCITHSGIKSSKKIIKDTGDIQFKFQSCFTKVNQISSFMEELSRKYKNLIEEHEFPYNDKTLDNLSEIAESIQQKLQLCDITQTLQREMQENQLELLKNLQNECLDQQKNGIQNGNRTKIVELGQVKEVLKMTKEVNRELMDQINQKEYIIEECKRYYECLLKNRGKADNRKIKALLNINV